jgi:hypothetical protein
MPAQSGLSLAAWNTALFASLHARDLGSLLPILGKDSRHRLRRDRARRLTRGVAAHAVANDEQGVKPSFVTPDDYCILILFTLETGIGRPCDPKPHQWPGWWRRITRTR